MSTVITTRRGQMESPYDLRPVPNASMQFYPGPYAGGWLLLAWVLLAVGAWAVLVGIIWLVGLILSSL